MLQATSTGADSNLAILLQYRTEQFEANDTHVCTSCEQANRTPLLAHPTPITADGQEISARFGGKADGTDEGTYVSWVHVTLYLQLVWWRRFLHVRKEVNAE